MFETGLTQLLDKLKTNGWTPSERAIVLLEWQKSLGSVWLNPNGLHASDPYAQEMKSASSFVCDELKKLEHPDDLLKFALNTKTHEILKKFSIYTDRFPDMDMDHKKNFIFFMMEKTYTWWTDNNVDRAEYLDVMSDMTRHKIREFSAYKSSQR